LLIGYSKTWVGHIVRLARKGDGARAQMGGHPNLAAQRMS